MLLDLVVKPRSSRVKVGPMVEGRLQVSVTAPPVDGAANAAVIEALAEALGVPKRAITIVRGETGRKKTVSVEGVTAAAVKAAIG